MSNKEGYLLVVEDVPDILLLLDETLKFKGYRVVRVTSTPEVGKFGTIRYRRKRVLAPTTTKAPLVRSRKTGTRLVGAASAGTSVAAPE